MTMPRTSGGNCRSGKIESLAKRISEETGMVYSYYEVLAALNTLTADESPKLSSMLQRPYNIAERIDHGMTPKQYGMSLKKKKRLKHK